MLHLDGKTRISQSKEFPISTGEVVAAEGVALMQVLEDGEECVKPTTAAGTEYLNGTLPAELVTFEFTITPTTDMNLVYLPMDMAGSTLGDVAASIGHQNANTISIWNSDTQNWVTASYISYYDAWTFSTEPVSAGQALMIGAVQNFTWPAR